MSQVRDASVLVELLSHSLGAQAAHEKVASAIRKLELDPQRLTEADALQVLDELAHEKGIVGASARFSRARLMLVWARDEALE